MAVELDGSKGVIDTVKRHGSLTSATNLNFNEGQVQTFTVGGAFTATVTNPPADGKATAMLLEITNGSSSTLTWDPQIIWAGGSAPSLTASGIDLVSIWTEDAGASIYGNIIGADYS